MARSCFMILAASDLSHYMRLRAKQGIKAIVLDFSRMTGIDVSAIRAVEAITADASADGNAVYTVGMSDQVRQMLKALDADNDLKAGNAFGNRIEALTAAKAGLG